MHQMVHQGVDILSGESSILDFGALLHEGWQLKRRMSSRITNSVIDEIYAGALDVGAVGGKLLGAGGGGFMLLMVPPERQNDVQLRLKKLIRVRFAFENSGSNIIFHRSVAA